MDCGAWRGFCWEHADARDRAWWWLVHQEAVRWARSRGMVETDVQDFADYYASREYRYAEENRRGFLWAYKNWLTDE